jgi:hypothetical protein
MRKDMKPISSESGFIQNLSENNLRMGYVTNSYASTDAQNSSKSHYQYDVMCYVSNSNGKVTPKEYFKCVVMDTFGAAADSFYFTPRSIKADEINTTPFSKGSCVLILCVNSDMNQGVIIGGYPNLDTKPVTDSTDLGHHLRFLFNGVQISINDDGSVSMVRNGATDDLGEVKSQYKDNGGATVKMETDGSVMVSSGTSNAVSIKLDPSSGQINLTSKGDVTVKCDTGKGLVINEGSHPMVRGDEMVNAIVSLMNGVANSLNAITPGAATTGGVAAIPGIQAAIAQFQAQSTQYLSNFNKVD